MKKPETYQRYELAWDHYLGVFRHRFFGGPWLCSDGKEKSFDPYLNKFIREREDHA